MYPQYKNEDGTDFGHLNSNYIYNSTGHRAFVRRVDALNPDARRDYSSMLSADLTLNIDKYNAQGPFYLSDMFAMSYFTSFMTIAAGDTYIDVSYWSCVSLVREKHF